MHAKGVLEQKLNTMPKKIPTVLYIILLITSHVSAAVINMSNDSISIDSDKKYVSTPKHSIGLNSAYNINYMHLAMIDDKGNQRFTYYPNLRGIMNFRVNYKILSLSYSYNIRENDLYDKYYGQTTFRDFGFSIKTRPFWLDVYYENYEGFFIDEKQDFFPSFALDSVYMRNSKLSTFRLGMRAHFIMNSNYSMRAAFEFDELQKKSAGSLILLINPQLSNLRAPEEPLIPEKYKPYYSGLLDYERGRFYNIGTGMGYGYSLVIGPLNFSNALMVGPSFQLYFFDGIKIRLPYHALFRSGLSVNFKHFYAGAAAAMDINNLYLNENRIRKQGLVITFRMGFRLFSQKD